MFLDGDIIVRGSLDSLTAVKGFAAVRILNIFRTTLKGQFHNRNRSNKNLYDELASNCDLSRPAFNSGVMAFDSGIISEDDFQNLKSILLRFKDILYISEETVLNICFYNKWQELSQVYNICPSYEMYHSRYVSSDLRGIVLHTYSNFPGGKPWNPKSPLYTEWKSNLDKADMIDTAKPQDTKKILSKREEEEYDFYLKNLHKRYFHKFYSYKIRYFCTYNQYRFLAGAFLRKNYPKVYKLLRKLSKKK